MKTSEKDIIEMGFIEVGSWHLDGNYKYGIDHQVGDSEERSLIFAFVSEDELKHLGYTGITLKKRMEEYRSHTNAIDTEGPVAEKIKDLLEQDKEVKIYVLTPSSKLKFYLIRELVPPWNPQGKKPSMEGVTGK